MNKYIKYTLIAFIIIAIAAFSVWKFMWSKDHRTAEGEKPVATLTATQLYVAYENDEATSNTSYLDKTIQVSGKVMELASEPNGTTVVLLETQSALGAVSCSFSPVNGKPAELNISTEQVITLKGICKGFAMDVVIEHCS
ncbi:MAG: hypothetical protein SGI87_01310, partial [Flavobacteriales bacterium]|nr:hypothetical protein [Flavobacteriales bacterium]